MSEIGVVYLVARFSYISFIIYDRVGGPELKMGGLWKYFIFQVVGLENILKFREWALKIFLQWRKKSE